MKQYFILIIFTLCIMQSVFAQTVTRGPYLQSLTPTSIKIKWRTSTATDSRVYYGTDPVNLSLFTDVATSVTDHTVKLSNLQSYTTYYYSVGTTAQTLSGPGTLHRFKTSPASGTEQPYRFWVIGDFGKANQPQADVRNSYVNYTGSTHTDMWLWMGDNAYDNGTDAQYQTKVFDIYTDIMKYMPFYPCPGNHDYESVCAIPCFSDPDGHSGPYFDMIDVPMNGEAGGVASGYELYYSFDYGNAHFISLNSELGSLLGNYDWNGVFSSGNFNSSPVKQWLINDLTANTKPWVIAYFHQAPYTKGSHDSDNPVEIYMKAMRENYLPLLEQYGVDLVLCGHSHVFERSYLLKGHYGTSSSFSNTHKVSGASGKFSLGEQYIKYTDGPNPNTGTVYVVVGNSGSGEPGAALNYPAMYYGDDGYGSFVIDLDGMRLDGKYLRSDGTIGDEFTIVKTSTLSGYVEGVIKSEAGHAIPGVTLNLAGTGAQTVTTGIDGSYRFNITQSGNYTITPEKDNDVTTSNGVTTNDILMIRRQILAIQPLSTAYKVIAADVNETGSVTTTDIILIQSLILGNTSTFPNSKLWTFVPSNHVFGNPQNPFPYPASLSYNTISQISGDDYIGMKLGDVNNSWDASTPKSETVGTVQFVIDKYDVSLHGEVVVPVGVKDFDNITGYQFTLSWDANILSLIEVNNKVLNGYYGLNKISEGYLTTSWHDDMAREITLTDNDVVFELNFKAMGAPETFSEIKIGSELIRSEAYNENIDLLSIASENGTVKVGDFSSIVQLQAQPNPFSNSTSIVFETTDDETVNMVIYDLLGRLVKTVKADYNAGKHKMEWKATDENGKSLSNGLYYVKITANNYSKSLKVELLK